MRRRRHGLLPVRRPPRLLSRFLLRGEAPPPELGLRPARSHVHLLDPTQLPWPPRG